MNVWRRARVIAFLLAVIARSSFAAPDGVDASLVARVERVRRHEPLPADALRGFGRLELRVLRNAAYASHGQRFQSPELQAFFSAFAWYTPRRASVDGSVLSETDRRNLALIKAAEERASSDPSDHWVLVSALAEADPPDGRKMSAEERELLGTWGSDPAVPAEELVTRREAYDFSESGIVTRRLEHCTDPLLARVGRWSWKSPDLLEIHWFAELRAVGGEMVATDGACPTVVRPPQARLVPVGERETVRVSQATYDPVTTRVFGGERLYAQ